MNITIVSGSPRKQSITVRVALGLLHCLQERNPTHRYSLLKMSEINLSFVDKVWSTINDVPAEHKEWAQTIIDTDAFIVVTPEYNGGYSPSMKNMFDHFPKQARKVFGIVTASNGAMGGMRAAQQMQNLVCGLFGIPCPYMLLVPAMEKKFDAEGNLIDQAFSASLHTFTSEMVWLSEAVAHSKEKRQV